MAEIREHDESHRKAGAQINLQQGYGSPYIEFEAPYHSESNGVRQCGYEGMDGVEITPIDNAFAKVRIFDADAIAGVFEGKWIVTPGKMKVSDLPNVLNEVSVIFNKTIGDGASSYPISQQEFEIYVRGGGSISPKASAEGSASILPSVVYDIDEHYREKMVDCIRYSFYLTKETDIAAVLDKLTAKALETINNFPDFRPKSHQVSCRGQQVSVQSRASSDASLSVSIDADDGITSETISSQYGSEYSRSNGVSEKVENIPLAIHGPITIADNTDSADVSATVEANTLALYVLGVEQIGAITNEPATVEGTAEASAVFENGTDTIPGTGGDTAIPTSGKYLVQLDAESDETFGFVKIRAVVVDFSQYAD